MSSDRFSVAVVQFPGSNTERETCLALKRAGLEPVEFLWNEPPEKLRACVAAVITGGFAYEDRARAGVIASLDPVMETIRAMAEEGKPILGICNGAQVLVESGLVPGLADGRVGMALAHNRRVRNGHVLGTGYYNSWCHLKLSTTPSRTPFTQLLDGKSLLRVPLAHGEGRFLVPEELRKELWANGQTIFQYADEWGKVAPDFPVNPNGSDDALAAISNGAGNVLAMMPHPERSPGGDAVFHSLKQFLESRPALPATPLRYRAPHPLITPFVPVEGSRELIVELIITDNEAASVRSALRRKGLPVDVSRRTHWEITLDSGAEPSAWARILESGELFNPNKERTATVPTDRKSESFLVRQRDDLVGRKTLETLAERFRIAGIQRIRRGILWTLALPEDRRDETLQAVLQTHILFNPYSEECSIFAGASNGLH